MMDETVVEQVYEHIYFRYSKVVRLDISRFHCMVHIRSWELWEISDT
ncbi:hypothetical protein VCR15J2_340190 [Vibrio coralliirubri]|nr:hypothetical protein VCR15J2_340190 [Vibrio coralliirubri]